MNGLETKASCYIELAFPVFILPAAIKRAFTIVVFEYLQNFVYFTGFETNNFYIILQHLHQMPV